MKQFRSEKKCSGLIGLWHVVSTNFFQGQAVKSTSTSSSDRVCYTFFYFCTTALSIHFFFLLLFILRAQSSITSFTEITFFKTSVLRKHLHFFNSNSCIRAPPPPPKTPNCIGSNKNNVVKTLNVEVDTRVKSTVRVFKNQVYLPFVTNNMLWPLRLATQNNNFNRRNHNRKEF